MKDWAPKLKEGLDYSKLELTGEEGFLLSRIDGATTVTHLTHLTGMPQGKVRKMLGRLLEQGALADDGAPTELGGSPVAKPRRRPDPTMADEEPLDEVDDLAGPATLPDEGEVDGDGDGDRDAATAPPAEALVADDGEDAALSEEGAPETDDEPAAEGEQAEAEAEADDEPEEVEGEPGNWRRYFEENLHPLDTDERAKLAREASGITLVALCFDPNPRVILILVENLKIGLQHARLIAEHHRVSTGLDGLMKRAAFVRDRQVQRLLFRNPQLSDRFFQRVMQNKRMLDAYQLVNNRDATERVRVNARKVFRDKFLGGTAEERVNLIVKCEGRCLNLLLGLSLEGRTISLLCQRPMHSTLLIQNLARWPSTPPPVLTHLYKQPLVKRTPVLKTLIQRHPNAPNQIKRGGAA